MRGANIVLPAVLLSCGVYAQSQESVEPRTGSAERTVIDSRNPFLGTWEMDVARTKLGARTVKMEPAGDSIRMVTGMGQYEFKLDGKEYPTDMPGTTVSWKKMDDNTYEVTTREDGKVTSTSTRVMSSDGNRATVTTKPAGSEQTITSVYERQSGDAGGGDKMLGTWRQTRQLPASGTPPSLTYEAVAEGMRAHYQGLGTPQEYLIRLDGQDHPVTEGAPAGTTLATTRLDNRSFEEVWKRSGKVFSKSAIRVSPDGRELTETQQPADSQSEASEYVYSRKM
jgi:hypothetical protein